MTTEHKLERQVRTALDETRLLILGSQILFGFQFNGAFQRLFDSLPPLSRWLHAISLLCLVVTVGLLIVPSLQHRIVEQGHCSTRILRVASRCAASALLFFAISLGIDLFTVSARLYGERAGILMGTGFCAAALLFWFGLEYAAKAAQRGDIAMRETDSEQQTTPLNTRIEQMLTEARVIIPGAQALLGFQLAVTMTDAFEKMPDSYKLIHTLAFAAIALAVILLIAPASFHRLAFGGENNEAMFRIGSRLVVAATVPLATGIALDTFVAVGKTLGSGTVAAGFAAAAFLVLLLFWYVRPLMLRRRHAA